MPKNLFKTTIIIWSDEDPTELDLEMLARDATSGASYCSKQKTEIVKNPDADSDWDGTEFFDED